MTTGLNLIAPTTKITTIKISIDKSLYIEHSISFAKINSEIILLNATVTSIPTATKMIFLTAKQPIKATTTLNDKVSRFIFNKVFSFRSVLKRNYTTFASSHQKYI